MAHFARIDKNNIVQKVIVNRMEDDNAYQIRIEYLPDNSTETESTEVYLERT